MRCTPAISVLIKGITCCLLGNNCTLNFALYCTQAKWKFTDLTHAHSLSAELIERLHGSKAEGGVIHHVKLTDESGAQPFDIGATITVLASASGQAKVNFMYG